MQRKENKKKVKFNGKKLRVAIVVSSFNNDITGRMLEGAIKTLEENSVDGKNIEIFSVPGAFEIPLACKKIIAKKKYNGLVALGCVIKGETDHYYYISKETARGIMNVMLESSVPIGFGVLTVDNLKQARERSGKKGNKGSEAAQAVLEMI